MSGMALYIQRPDDSGRAERIKRRCTRMKVAASRLRSESLFVSATFLSLIIRDDNSLTMSAAYVCNRSTEIASTMSELIFRNHQLIGGDCVEAPIGASGMHSRRLLSTADRRWLR
jgi:hypothetical protein